MGHTERQEEEEYEEKTMTDMVPLARSVGVCNSRLNKFKVPHTNLNMASRRLVEVNPFNTGINPMTFQVVPEEDFIDSTKSFLKVELLAKKVDANNLLIGDMMVLVNNLAHSLFKQINLRLNSTLISPQSDTYHYKAFVRSMATL